MKEKLAENFKNQSYVNFLRKHIFKINEQASFSIMFDMFNEINSFNQKSIILERSFIYNGKSIFAGLLNSSCDVIDYRCSNSNSRSGFQSNWIDKSIFKFQNANFVYNEDQNINNNICSDAEILIIPNVLHHCKDFNKTIIEIFNNLKKISKIFIYDSYLRENHQNPNDYCRYTISGIDNILKQFKFKRFYTVEYGNIFDAILYLMDQAKTNVERFKELNFLIQDFNILKTKLTPIRNVKKFRDLGRPFASMETSYSVGYSLNE